MLFSFKPSTAKMTSGQIEKLMQRLDEISSRQEEYQNKFLGDKDKTAAASDIVSESVDLQGRQLHELAEMITSVRCAVDQIAAQVQENERRLDDMEQYGRSNCLILHGCKDLSPKDAENKVVEKHVIDVLNSKLQLNTPLTSLDIDICHFLPSKKGKNPIIIKFVRRTVRNEIFNNKSKLKSLDSNSRLAITESLTKRRLKLVDEARHVFDFKNVWTMKGFVYCRFQGQRHYIDDFSDISRIRLGPTKQA